MAPAAVTQRTPHSSNTSTQHSSQPPTGLSGAAVPSAHSTRYDASHIMTAVPLSEKTETYLWCNFVGRTTQFKLMNIETLKNSEKQTYVT